MRSKKHDRGRSHVHDSNEQQPDQTILFDIERPFSPTARRFLGRPEVTHPHEGGAEYAAEDAKLARWLGRTVLQRAATSSLRGGAGYKLAPT